MILSLRSLLVAVSTLSAAFLFACPADAQTPVSGRTSPMEASLVTVEVARNQFDYNQPWIRKPRRLKKTGVVVEGNQVLTTADQLQDRTLVRLQKNGRGSWWIANVAWIDYHANLALLKVDDADFWGGLKPVTFGSVPPNTENLQILRWRDGTFENRRAEFSRYTVRESPLSQLNRVFLEMSSDIQNAGWSEPVMANSHVTGLLIAQDGRVCIAMPASFIQTVLEAQKNGTYKGMGYFHFYWQPAENPAVLASHGLPDDRRGVLISLVPNRPDRGDQTLQRGDILLRIDGFDLDVQGDYEDPEFGPLMLENLSSRGKWAGDAVPIRIWREGKEMDIVYQLPRYEYTNSIVPFANYDEEPEYMVVGGLVFQPLTSSFLQSWGPEWKRRSPFRLFYFTEQLPTQERPSLVVLSQVLPDPFNIGYQEQRFVAVDTVNNRTVNSLADLQAALQHPVEGYHEINFIRSDSLRRMVIAAGAPESEATTRILKRYGIGKASVIR